MAGGAGSGADPVGGILSGAASLISAVGNLFGTSGNSAGSQQGTQTTLQTGTQTTAGTSNTLTTGSTVNSADPAVIAALKGLVGSEESDATNAQANSANLISGIFTQAKNSFGQIFGQASGAGLYNSSAEAEEQGQAEATAAAQASQAVLNYQTQEQQLAGSGLNSLLSATATQQTSGSSSTTTDQTTTQDNTTKESAKSQSLGNTNTGKDSIICTHMAQEGLLDNRKFAVCSRHFNSSYSGIAKRAYLQVAHPTLRFIISHPKSRITKFVLAIFYYRTEHIAASNGFRGAQKSLKSHLSKTLIYTVVTAVGLGMLVGIGVKKAFQWTFSAGPEAVK